MFQGTANSIGGDKNATRNSLRSRRKRVPGAAVVGCYVTRRRRAAATTLQLGHAPHLHIAPFTYTYRILYGRARPAAVRPLNSIYDSTAFFSRFFSPFPFPASRSSSATSSPLCSASLVIVAKESYGPLGFSLSFTRVVYPRLRRVLYVLIFHRSAIQFNVLGYGVTTSLFVCDFTHWVTNRNSDWGWDETKTKPRFEVSLILVLKIYQNIILCSLIVLILS